MAADDNTDWRQRVNSCFTNGNPSPVPEIFYTNETPRFRQIQIMAAQEACTHGLSLHDTELADINNNRLYDQNNVRLDRQPRVTKMQINIFSPLLPRCYPISQ